LSTKHLGGKFYYLQHRKKLILEVFTTAIVNILVFWDMTP